MKKLLLSILSVAAVSFATTAVETSYTITFLNGENNNGTEINAKTAVNSVVENGVDFVSGFSATTKTSLGLYGLKIGENKNAGAITVDLSANGKVKATKIEIQASANKNPLKQGFKVNGTAYELTTSAINDAYTTITITPSEATEISAFKLEKSTAAGSTSTKQGWVFVKSIKVYYDAEGPVKQESGLKFDAEEITVVAGETFETPELVNPNNLTVKYSSDDENIAEVNEETGVVTLGTEFGTATITATFDGNDNFFAASPSYKITVKNPNTIIEDGDNFTGFTYESNDIEGQTGKTVWSNSSYKGNKYAKASAYVSGTRCVSSAYLVTPEIDLSGRKAPATLTFDQVINNMGDAISNAADYLSVEVREGTEGEWTKLDVDKWPTTNAYDPWIASTVDLAAYAGKKIQIAFHYTSTADVCCTWEVDNVVVSAEKTTNAINSIVADDAAEAEYYNLQGVRVAAPESGLYIVRRGNKVTKELVK